MASENVFATQVTLGLLGSGILNLLKKSNLVKFVNDNSGTLNHLILLITSGAGALGVHAAWNASSHSLTITGLDFATILTTLWLWSKQWAIQFLVQRGAFGPVSLPGAGANPAAGVSTKTSSVAGVGGMMPGKPLVRISVRRLAFLCFGLALFCGLMLFSGCAAAKYTAANVNQTTTTVIADAGQVAIQAEQSYAAGKIPQNEYTRGAINDLGNAYNQAKVVYAALLQAEATYNYNQAQQIAACQPASTQGGVVPDPVKCTTATQNATTAKAGLDTAQVSLSTSLQALSTKTAAVKAIKAQ